MSAAILLALSAVAQRSDSKEMVRLLKQTTVSVELADTPLDELADLAGGYIQKNVIVSSKVQGDPRFTIKLTDVSLATLLKVTLRPRGLTVTARDGVLVIVPLSDVAEPIVTKVYDIGDYVLPLLNHPPHHMMVQSIMTMPQNVLFGHEGRMGPIFASLDAADEQTAEQEMALDALYAMIETHTGGNSWTEDPRVTISFVNGKWVLSQTAPVHEEVRAMLARLRSFR